VIGYTLFMASILTLIEEKKIELDSHRPFAPVVKKNMDNYFKNEVTYTSSSLSGGTLNRIETLLITEQGITTRGKSITEQLEALNVSLAYEYAKSKAEVGTKIPLQILMISLYDKLIDKIYEDQKGRFRSSSVRLTGLTYIPPESAVVPQMVSDLSAKIETMADAKAPYLASFVHGEIARICPFPVANLRLARLVGQYMLLERGYSPFILQTSKRHEYLGALEELLVYGKIERHNNLILGACEKSMIEALKFFNERDLDQGAGQSIKIGQLASMSKETVVTIRYWAKNGLITPINNTPGGYMLFVESDVKKAKLIRSLQKIGYSLMKIKQEISKS
jgi:Fic family protein